MKAVVIGSTGYGGVELIRLLQGHPHAKIGAMVSSSAAGKPLGDVYPHAAHLAFSLEEMDVEKIAESGDVIFFATPPGVSGKWAPAFLERGKIVIDLSGDFRLGNPETYQQWYQREPAPVEWMERAVYGLSEWYSEQVAKASLIANPGCYPTATLLAILPLLKEGLIHSSPLVVDAKSGVSGAGRGLSEAKLYCEVNENLYPYKIGVHQHTPELERFVEAESGEPVKILFTPHLVPMNRGILANVYAQAKPGVTSRDVADCYRSYYEKAPFVRLKPEGEWPQTKHVRGSNFCDLGWYVDERTGTITTVAVIDNLMKGAAGQAVQNLNLRMGWPETAGLEGLPFYP